MAIKTFDPLKVSLSLGPNIITGFTNGTIIEIVSDGEAYTTTRSEAGDSSRHQTNNRDYTATINLTQGSPSNDILSIYYNLDLQSGAGSFPFFLRDYNGSTTMSCLYAFVKNQADPTLGVEEVNRTWVLQLTQANYFVGGF